MTLRTDERFTQQVRLWRFPYNRKITFLRHERSNLLRNLRTSERYFSKKFPFWNNSTFSRENRRDTHPPFVKTYATLGFLWRRRDSLFSIHLHIHFSPPKSPSFEVENKTKINGNIPHCSESNWDRDGIRTKDRQEFLKSSPASFPQILSPRSSFLFFVFGVSRPIWGTTHPRRRQPSSPGPRPAASAAAATNGQQRNNSCVLLVVRDVCVKACESASIIFKKKKAEDT